MADTAIKSTVDHLRGAGLTLDLTPERGLRVAPASGLTPALRDLIRAHKPALVDYLTDAANEDLDPFSEPDGYLGTGWRLAGAAGLTAATLAKFRLASQKLDAHQPANDVKKQGAPT